MEIRRGLGSACTDAKSHQDDDHLGKAVDKPQQAMRDGSETNAPQRQRIPNHPPEDTTTMRPEDRSREGNAESARRTEPSKLTRIGARTCRCRAASVVYSRTRESSMSAWFRTRTSISPLAATALLASDSASSASPMSDRTTVMPGDPACSPSALTSCSLDSRRAAMVSLAPSWAYLRASCRPIPVLAPVISTCLPWSPAKSGQGSQMTAPIMIATNTATKPAQAAQDQDPPSETDTAFEIRSLCIAGGRLRDVGASVAALSGSDADQIAWDIAHHLTRRLCPAGLDDESTHRCLFT